MKRDQRLKKDILDRSASEEIVYKQENVKMNMLDEKQAHIQ